MFAKTLFVSFQILWLQHEDCRPHWGKYCFSGTNFWKDLLLYHVRTSTTLRMLLIASPSPVLSYALDKCSTVSSVSQPILNHIFLLRNNVRSVTPQYVKQAKPITGHFYHTRLTCEAQGMHTLIFNEANKSCRSIVRNLSLAKIKSSAGNLILQTPQAICTVTVVSGVIWQEHLKWACRTFEHHR